MNATSYQLISGYINSKFIEIDQDLPKLSADVFCHIFTDHRGYLQHVVALRKCTLQYVRLKR